MLTILMTLLHIAVALFLIAVVLLQTGKRADLAGAFGGGGSQTAFGTRGAATALTKMTTFAAVVFMLTSITLSIVSSKSRGRSESVLEDVPAAAETVPADLGEEPGLPTLPPLEPEPDAAADDASTPVDPE
jgi:preprotein translocase subunit SecG